MDFNIKGGRRSLWRVVGEVAGGVLLWGAAAAMAVVGCFAFD